MADDIFRREVIDGREFVLRPMLIYDSTVIGPGKATAQFDFAGHPETTDRHLDDTDEAALVSAAIQFAQVRSLVLSAFALDEPAWILLGARREKILPDNPQGKPGEYDLICGPIRDGRFAFSPLCESEIKIRRVSSADELRSAASGYGTTQARKVLELGFEGSLLLHVIVRTPEAPSGGSPPTWDSYTGPDTSEMEAAYRQVAHVEGENLAPYGFGLLGWGQSHGSDARLCGTLSPQLVRPVPKRPLDGAAGILEGRGALVRGLTALLGTNRPAPPLLAVCVRCGRLFVPVFGQIRCC